MFNFLRHFFTVLLSVFDSLSGEEERQANEAKQRALNILHDALKKKDRLLVEDRNTFGEQKTFTWFPLISTALVRDLISELQKVTFKRSTDPKMDERANAYVYPTKPGTIYLCSLFWKLPEYLKLSSRPKTLIHEVSHFLGYGHTIEENHEKVKNSPQYKLCPVSIRSIEEAFALYMNHRVSYKDGCYSCCGETSRDTLCDESIMSWNLSMLKLWASIEAMLPSRKRDASGLFLDAFSNSGIDVSKDDEHKRRRMS